MSIQVKSFSLPGYTAAGVFSSIGVSIADYEVYIESNYTLTIVNSASDSVGYPIINPVPFRGTSGSEIYVYNTAYGRTATVIVMLTPRLPVAASPSSATTTFSY